MSTMPKLQSANIARVQSLVAEFQNGNPAGYMAGVADNVKASMLGGLIPGADDIKSKDEFMAVMQKVNDYMEIEKFEPKNWRAVGDDVYFNVEWSFTWKPTGKKVETTAIVRKVVKDNLICEKYHMIDTEAVTGEKMPHDHAAVERVKELLAEFQAGNPAGYMAGVAEDVQASMLGGLIPGADSIQNKDEFQAVMDTFGDFMEVQKFEPVNFRAMPNNDMMFNVNWVFVWKATGKTVETTAIVRKVVKDNLICEKYHLVDCDAVLDSPREVIGA